MTDLPPPDEEPPGGWPTQPRRMFDKPEGMTSEQFAAEYVRRGKAAQARANRRQPGRYEPDPPAPSPRAQAQERWIGVVGELLAGWRTHNLTGHVADVVPEAQRWLEKPKGVLLIVGNIGSGKTSLAAALAHEHHAQGRPVVMAPFGDLLASFEHDDPAEPPSVTRLRTELNRLTADHLLIVDDLATTLGTYPSTTRTLTSRIDRWLSARVRVVITTNLDKTERGIHLEERLASRIERSGAQVVVVGPDLRGQPIPEGPHVGPCPYECTDGWVHLDTLPDAHERIERELAHYGIHEPDPDEFPSAEALNNVKDFNARMYDHVGASTVPCPHCFPERQRPGWAQELRERR